MATIVGTVANDNLHGTDENDRIWGLGGSDIMDGAAGNDRLDGGAGNDVLTSSSGYDELDGADGDDRFVLTGTGGAARGGAGVDTLAVDLSSTTALVRFNSLNGHGLIGDPSAAGNHIYFRDVERLELTTGSGNDTVQGDTGDDVISTGDGRDWIGPQYPNALGERSSYGSDTIDAGAGDDTIDDTFGDNHIFGGIGNDAITTTLSSAEIDGGDGYDQLWLYDSARTENVTMDFVSGVASTGATIHNFEDIYIETGSGDDTIIATDLPELQANTGAGDDRVEGGNGNDGAYGGDGNDVLLGGGGKDSLGGGSGDDRIEGHAGNDWLTGNEGTDVLLGGEGDDRIEDGAGNDETDGGNGNDELRSDGGDDKLFGGDGNDTLTTTGGADVLNGGNGNDLIVDASPSDEIDERLAINGGAGDDVINVFSSASYQHGEIDGGEGKDNLHISFFNPPVAVDFDAASGSTGTGLTFVNIEDFRVYADHGHDHMLRGADGNDWLGGGTGNDLLEGRSGNDELWGGEGNDVIRGDNGADTLSGEIGDDVMEGGAGDDEIFGMDGADQLNGGEGTDVLSGGNGADFITGGDGADIFTWSRFISDGGVDHIIDFDTGGGDVIEISRFDIADYNAFLAVSHDTEDGVYVSFDGETDGILIEGVTLAELSADDVVFT